MTKSNLFEFTVNNLNAELVYVKFKRPTNFNPNFYPALKDMGKWTGNKEHTVVILRTRKLDEYKEDVLINTLEKEKFHKTDYTIKTFPMGGLGVPNF
ncbi:hypothetical protein GA840_00365 [Pediococcus ethanolidurans]|uniref:hypothetical protein n=1 Tax=Pediococcus ethanolidurans TaxID=319653 RepID=UPI002955D50C|nr:hypothetical protein [Pediococcus ethanolidurans]MDV7718341.1 hypothetical protein [Pediococcus ethanolidurans]